MAVEKIYQPYDEATQTSIPQRQPQSRPEKQTVKRKVVVQLTRFEKVLYITLITVIAMISIYMLSLKWMRMIRGKNCRFRSKNRKTI